MIPVYGFLAGDTLGILLLLEEDDNAREIVAKLQRSSRLRVSPRADLCVVHAGVVIDPGARLADTPIESLDRVDVVPRDSVGERSASR